MCRYPGTSIMAFHQHLFTPLALFAGAVYREAANRQRHEQYRLQLWLLFYQQHYFFIVYRRFN